MLNLIKHNTIALKLTDYTKSCQYYIKIKNIIISLIISRVIIVINEQFMSSNVKRKYKHVYAVSEKANSRIQMFLT